MKTSPVSLKIGTRLPVSNKQKIGITNMASVNVKAPPCEELRNIYIKHVNLLWIIYLHEVNQEGSITKKWEHHLSCPLRMLANQIHGQMIFVKNVRNKVERSGFRNGSLVFVMVWFVLVFGWGGEQEVPSVGWIASVSAPPWSSFPSSNFHPLC